MTQPDPVTGGERSQYVQREFSAIARRYEMMNQLMTFGQVNRLRRDAIRRLRIGTGAQILDHGAGSGQISRLLRKMYPAARVTASDFNAEMIVADGLRGDLPFVLSDARYLPFPSAQFSGYICGYLLRNISDYPVALKEVVRVLQPGGYFVSLDTTPPAANLMRPFIRVYMRIMIPLLGWLITGRWKAYAYLVRSSENFSTAEELRQALNAAGLVDTGYEKKLFGTLAVHWGRKPLHKE